MTCDPEIHPRRASTSWDCPAPEGTDTHPRGSCKNFGVRPGSGSGPAHQSSGALIPTPSSSPGAINWPSVAKNGRAQRQTENDCACVNRTATQPYAARSLPRPPIKKPRRDIRANRVPENWEPQVDYYVRTANAGGGGFKNSGKGRQRCAAEVGDWQGRHPSVSPLLSLSQAPGFHAGLWPWFRGCLN